MKYHILFLFAACIFSCAYFSSKKYGLKFNEERSELGLPLLCESWESTVVSLTNGGYKWINPERSELTNKYFSEKSLIILGDSLIRESNYIIGEQEYNGSDIDFFEKLEIRYVFKAKDDEYVGLRYFHTTGKSFTSGNRENYADFKYPEEKEITKEAADSLLHLWRIDLNRCK